VAQAEARTAAAISSEAVAQESLKRIQDQRMQEWTNGGTPVPAIGEAQVLLGTPLVGWEGTIEVPQHHQQSPNPQQRQLKPQHSLRKTETPKAGTMTSCSFRWKNTRPQKMALLASSRPSDPDPGNEAVLVQVAPLVLSRVVCPHSRDVSSSLVCNKNLFVLACLLCACCVLTSRSRPCLFKKKSDIIHLNIT
jgi:hypothetical protein